MSEVKITDLVPQETIDKVKTLDTEIQTLLVTYTNTAKELAKGVDINVRVVGDINKLEKMLVEKTKEATETTQRLNTAMEEKSRVIANTSNTLARQLMEQERVNKTQRDVYAEYDRVKKLLENFNGSYDEHVKRLVSLNSQLAKNSKEQKDNEKALKLNRISATEYQATQAKLIEQHRYLTQEKRTLTQIMTAEEKAMQTADTSYVQLSQQLELLKKAYKDLGAEARASEIGRDMEQAIQNLDAHLKDLSADVGEHQRNVGNYAIAAQQGVVTTESVIAAMNQEARTTQDLVDQTKILEEAKLMLNKEDANYQSTLDSLNSKIEENKRKLTDVSDILGKEARTVSEAEAQNKRLSEAIKHIDLTSADAKKKLEEMRNQIQRNNETISSATGANEKFADSILNVIGINANLGSSFQALGQKGNFIDGLNTKTKAFGKTLMGLLANPWVLAILGIAGVVAGFKWWYDYNKGIIEASKLTKNFTDATGEAADKVTADMQTLADHMDKSYADTIGAANVLVQQFGISWEEATALMEKGLQAGADMNGNMLNMINQFGPALRDAGVDAEQFIAILSNTRNGIFDEKGVSDILKGGTRLRAMTKQIAESLEACGISSKKMQKDLTEGNITMLEAVQQVSMKLKELPKNSQEAGMLMKNVFGRTAAEGGTLLIQSLADIDTNLESCIESMGEMGEITAAQLEAERELNETLAAVFKMSGTSFEEMIGYAKVYVTQWLTQLIKRCVDIYNWFAKIYNESIAFRQLVGTVIAVFRTLWTAVKANFELIFNGFKSLGGAFEGLMMILSGDIEEGFNKIKENVVNGFKGMAATIKGAGTEIGNNFSEELDKATNNRMIEVNYTLSADDTTSKGSGRPGPRAGKYKPTVDKSEAAKAAKEAEKRAKEELKRINELEESKISLMAEGHEKELAMIRLKFKKKMDEIRGDGETEKALRIQLAEQCEKEVSDCEIKYQKELSKINLENRLASVEEGSKEELDLKLAKLEQSRKAELKEAEKTGAEVALINAKFEKERLKLQEDFADKQSDIVSKRFATEQNERDNAMAAEMLALQKQYAKELKEAGNNEEKRAKLSEKYEDDRARITEKYAQSTAHATVAMYEELLKNENLSAEARADIEHSLAAAKIAEEQAVTDATIAENERRVRADANAKGKRMQIAQQMMQATADMLNSVSELMGQLFDNQIEKIETQQEANDEANEKEQEQITELVNKKIITEEEGEARKRAAEAKTAKENEKLEKKKQQLKIKQAKWDKANSIAQATISTALAIMNALNTKPFWLGIAMAAIAGAMGAVQIATIAATPIPAYAKGTDYHKGGPAIVGDGGRKEVVLFNGNAWITPDKPTLVDIPAGAVVLPSINNFDDNPGGMVMIPYTPNDRPAPKGYDDSGIRRGVSEIAFLIRNHTKQQHADSYLTNYELFKRLI